MTWHPLVAIFSTGILLLARGVKAKNKPLALLLGLGLSATCNATLIDRGNGMIYDSDQDITWLQDANYAMTSGYSADGAMTWDQSVAWADSLSYGGYDDWRLPTVIDGGNDGCTSNSECGYVGNFDTSGSELAYMWYNNLGNTAAGGGAGWSQVSTSADGVDILNLQYFLYWSGTEYAADTNAAWVFYVDIGYQYYHPKNFDFQYAWAVRDGDVVTVATPATIMLLGVGLLGLGGVRRRPRHEGLSTP